MEGQELGRRNSVLPVEPAGGKRPWVQGCSRAVWGDGRLVRSLRPPWACWGRLRRGEAGLSTAIRFALDLGGDIPH